MTLSPAPSLTGVPVLETERLILRAPEAGDFEVMATFRASERARHVGGPNPRHVAFAQFCGLIGHWQMRGYGRFVMVERATLAPIGIVGPFFPEDWPEPEIAWTLWAAEAEGKGFAIEAATATRAFAYGVLGWTTAISLVDPANTRSVALARRMGCLPEGTFDHVEFGKMHIWRHPAPDTLTDGGMEAYA